MALFRALHRHFVGTPPRASVLRRNLKFVVASYNNYHRSPCFFASAPLFVPVLNGNDKMFPHSELESCLELLRNTNASIENIVAEILSLKNQSKPKPLLTLRLRELLTQSFIHFLTLRQVNRSILLDEEHARMETERAKVPLEFTTQQLQNLMYEKSHYLKAIKACNNFKSKYPDIEMLSEDEFFRDAPQDTKDSVLSNHGEHNLVLKRLNFELFQVN